MAKKVLALVPMEAFVVTDQVPMEDGGGELDTTVYVRDRVGGEWKQLVVNERRRLTTLEASDDVVSQLNEHYKRYQEWAANNALSFLKKEEPSPETSSEPAQPAATVESVVKQTAGSVPVRHV